MNYPDALEYIDSFINYEKTTSYEYPKDLGLDRMRALAKDLGNPQNSYESIIIAGSKGKGSTAAILSSILRMDNYKVGLYTSPHLLDIRERIQVNGLPISEARFIDCALKISQALDTYAWRKNPPTYFEVLTAMAFLHFKELKVEVAVLEVGLGGLYDSTNIAKAKVVGLTPISLEHTQKLGKTISKIAVQKCGVIKGRELVVSSAQDLQAQAVIAKTAEDKEAQLYSVGKDIKIFEREHTDLIQRFDVKTENFSFFDLKTHLLGFHQLENAAVAITLAKGLEKKIRISVSESAIRQGVLDARWPGRLEKIADHPTIVLDGAHNPSSIEKAIQGIKRHFEYNRLIVVFAVSADKDIEGILKQIFLETDQVIATAFSGERSKEPNLISQAAEDLGKKVIVEKGSRLALDKAKEMASDQDLILVTGSLYLVAEIKNDKEL